MHKPLALLATLLSIGAVFLATRRQEFRRVEANGAILRTLVTGRGTPTVVFEAGAGSPLETWCRIQPAVGEFASTFSYDRAGIGLSAGGDTPRDAQRIAAELHLALHKAQASPPYLLVGHSLGGPFIRVFAGMYPDEIAGLVLVDPTQEDLVAWAESREPQTSRKRPSRPHNEVDCAPMTFAQAKEARIPNVPVVLISGMGPRDIPAFLPAKLKTEVRRDQEVLYPAKLNFHRQWVESLPRGQLVITQNSGHGIPWEEPERVVEVIRDVVARLRSAGSSTIRPNKP